jgi:hypothetical protein
MAVFVWQASAERTARMKEFSMTTFNPMDPVHAAAKAFRDAVNAIFDARFGLQPDQFHRHANRLKRRAIDRMREELAQSHETIDGIHSAAFQLVDGEANADPVARQKLENALVGAVELALIEDGLTTR